MKRSLHLLFTLSTISIQLWAAEPARPSATFAAAAAAASPAGFDSKISIENRDYNKILAELKKIAATETFRMVPSEWRDPIKLKNKTNCMNVAHELVHLITGEHIDNLLKESSPFNSASFDGTMEQLVSKNTTEYENKVAQELFNASIEKEYKLFYGIKITQESIDKPNQATKYHIFLILKISSCAQTDYIILNTWYNAFCLAQWLDIDTLTLPHFLSMEGGLSHMVTYTKYNPSNKLTATDIIAFMNGFFTNEPSVYKITMLDISKTPFITEILSGRSPSVAPSGAAAHAASPSSVELAQKCAHPACPKEGAQTCNGCGIKKYCSRTCQKKDWRKHKLSCLPAPAKKS